MILVKNLLPMIVGGSSLSVLLSKLLLGNVGVCLTYNLVTNKLSSLLSPNSVNIENNNIDILDENKNTDVEKSIQQITPITVCCNAVSHITKSFTMNLASLVMKKVVITTISTAIFPYGTLLYVLY